MRDLQSKSSVLVYGFGFNQGLGFGKTPFRVP